MNWKITNPPSDLREGLFGQIILWAFELLPLLHQRRIYPVWDIKSVIYGEAPHFTVLPGVLDLNYTPDAVNTVDVDFLSLREAHPFCLGNDWRYLSELFFRYFKIPDRIEQAVTLVKIPAYSLGIHYRGTDKNTTHWDTNPLTHEHMLSFVADFLASKEQTSTIFIATDEYEFVEKARDRFRAHAVINLGKVDFFKESEQNNTQKSDRAMLDSVLISKCSYVLQSSSALSAFAKVLRPDLEIYRVRASKFFADVPYFPVAYLPKLETGNPDCQVLLDELYRGDWTQDNGAVQRFSENFRYRARYTRYQRLIAQLKFYLRLYVLGWPKLVRMKRFE